MKGRVFAYRHVADESGKARTVKLTKSTDDRKGAKWAFEFAVRDPATGKRKSVSKGGFTGQREAQRALTAALAEFEVKGRQVPTEPSRTAVSTYFAEVWLPAVRHTMKPTTIENHETLHRAYVRPHIGAMALRDVTPDTLTSLYSKLSAGGGRGGRPLSDMTVHHVAVHLSTMLGYAVERGALRSNPATSIPKAAKRKQPKRSPDKLLHWTSDQAAQFRASVAGDRLEALYVLALNLGLRRGELAGLKWSDVDLDGTTDGRPRLRVQRHRVMVGREVVEQTPKTDRSVRPIELGEATVAMLRAHKVRQLEERMRWGAAYHPEGDWIFRTEDGHPLAPTSITNKLESAARRAGVPWVTVHGLRHTCAVLLLEAGVPLKVVSERLGHTSTSFTADLYQHVIPGMQYDASTIIERRLGM